MNERRLSCDSEDTDLVGTGYHLKLSFQLKPPHVMSLPVMYSKVSSLMTSIIGQTTVFLSAFISDKSGSNQPAKTRNKDRMRMFEVWILLIALKFS